MAQLLCVTFVHYLILATRQPLRQVSAEYSKALRLHRQSSNNSKRFVQLVQPHRSMKTNVRYSSVRQKVFSRWSNKKDRPFNACTGLEPARSRAGQTNPRALPSELIKHRSSSSQFLYY